jgi:aminopeptidase N
MTSVKPTDYEITFEPDLKTFKFSGRERILVDIGSPESEIELNSAELKINGCRIVCNNETLKPKIVIDGKNESLLLKLPKRINGKAELLIDFEGILGDNLVGFYRSKYMTGKKERYLATTQFEATDARRAFPCWDDPSSKAAFSISLIIDKKLTAISNMPEIEKKKFDKNRNIVKFSKTPVMSTYLLYIGVGEFEFLEDRLDNVLIRVVTTPGKKMHGEFALDCAKKFLKYYDDYFRIKYPLPKLDLIAIPDFAAAAMENWGAITFREIELLYDPKNSSAMMKQRIAEVVAHEISHQWFGDLVTMQWWNELWLNESFATFMATKAVDAFYPEWEMWSQFLIDEMAFAMDIDALKASHPIDVKVRTSAEIGEIFDEISYSKGGSVLRMLEGYVGEDAFRKGLKIYLSAYKYGNATKENLWSSLEKSSGKDVKKMMDSWIKRTGYPIVEIEQKGSKLSLTQNRFLLEGIEKDNNVWSIPFSVIVEGKTISKMMAVKKDTIDIGEGWFKTNSGQKGFYRTSYPIQNINDIKNLVSGKKIPNADRWGVQDDLFSLAVCGKKTFREYLDFIEAYSNDDDYLVLSDIEKNLGMAYLIASKERFWPEIVEHNRKFLRNVFDRLTWEPRKNERHTDALLRLQTISYLGRTDDSEILKEGKKKFQDFLKNPDSVRPDIRGGVYSCAAWSGDKKIHETMIKLYKDSSVPEEKRRLLGALGGFKDPKLLYKTLQFSLSKDVRYQDIPFPVANVAGNPYGRDILWPWVKANWPELKKRLGSTKFLLGRIVVSLSAYADDKISADIKQFFVKNPESKIRMSVSQTLEKIRINRNFLENIRRAY